MRKYLNTMTMFALAFAFEQASYGIEKPTPFEPTMKPKKITRPKNHKPYIIEGVEIWALSEKRARDKFNKTKVSL